MMSSQFAIARRVTDQPIYFIATRRIAVSSNNTFRTLYALFNNVACIFIINLLLVFFFFVCLFVFWGIKPFHFKTLL